MLDINFFMKAHEVKKEILNGKKINKEELQKSFESFRNKVPVIYNIETTNACNMRCKMCPRTTMMTRNVETLSKETFIKIADQIQPFNTKTWAEWEQFVQTNYGIARDEMSENHFFLYIIPKVIQLHGYGDPLIDKNISEYINILTQKNINSYFSCNPANIDLAATETMMKNGLSYIKYSIESVDDEKHKSIRGEQSNFSKSYQDILTLLDVKKRNNYKTVIIITMLNLNRRDQQKEFELLQEKFEGLDVYIYLKSEDQQWYRKEFHQTQSIHWSEICQHPWLSMTIKSNGEAAMCMEDFDNEIILGNANTTSLYDIWNSDTYHQFRTDHFNLKPGIKCTEACDMKLVGNFL